MLYIYFISKIFLLFLNYPNERFYFFFSFFFSFLSFLFSLQPICAVIFLPLFGDRVPAIEFIVWNPLDLNTLNWKTILICTKIMYLFIHISWWWIHDFIGSYECVLLLKSKTDFVTFRDYYYSSCFCQLLSIYAYITTNELVI